MDRTDLMRERSPKAVTVPPTSPGQAKGKSWAAKFRRKSEDHQQEKKKQLHDYTAWVNSYLKRKPGTPLITDLRSNLQDGITLVNLIEIVAHVQLDGIVRCPNSMSSRRQNVEKAVDFLKLEGVVFQGDPTRDILDGNSKGIMRVILGMAERYQPRSVKQRSSSDVKQYFQEHKEARDHMTYTLYTEREGNMLKRSQSPEGNLKGLSSAVTNSFSVPNMASVNVHAGTSPSGKASVARSGSGYSHGFAGRGPVPSSSHGPVPSFSHGPVPSSSSPSGYPPPIPPKPFQFSSALFTAPPTQTKTAADRDDTYAIPADTLPPNVRARVIQPMKKPGQGRHHLSQHRAEERRARAVSSPIMGMVQLGGVVYPQADVLNQDLDEMLSGLIVFKEELLRLHNLLVKNSGGSEGEEDIAKNLEYQFAINEDRAAGDRNTTPTPTDRDTPLGDSDTPLGDRDTPTGQHQEVADKEKQAEQVFSMQQQLTRLQDEFTEKESECVMLRNMLEERNTYITTMKSEVYRKEYRNDTERVGLQNQLLQKDAAMKKLSEDLVVSKDTVDRKAVEYEAVCSQLELKGETESKLHRELEGVKVEVTQLRETEEALLGRVASRERKMGHLEDKITEMQDMMAKRAENVSEDVDGIRRRLNQLRAAYSPQDTQQQVIDQLEQHISEMTSQLVERSVSPLGKRSRRRRDSDDGHRNRERDRGDRDRGERDRDRGDRDRGERDRDRGDRDRERDRGEKDRDKERKKRHKEKQHSLHSAPSDGKAESTTPTSGLTSDITKVFYYILNDKNETPYVTLVPGRSNEITLRHFKSVFDRPGVFRFYFKTEDPDCGIVKEEITEADQILPNWKGKILVWISEKK